ncbi:hypothetical protein BJX70DRAFT_367016 [Aspergillus crustosus]
MSDTTKASKYRLKVTAGPSYDPSTHQDVPVNEAKTLHLKNEHASTNLSVRIQDYTGYPDDAPKTHPHFTHSSHTKDQYSITFGITFNKPVNGNDLLFGNDFDRPIRDRLPPGFNAALRLVQWTIDPSLDGDAYADKPYLYSPGVATWNQFRVGKKGGSPPDVHDLVVEEGEDDNDDDDGGGDNVREGLGVPETIDGRRGFFGKEENRKAWEFEKDRVYYAGFGNGYLDFNEFTLRLPGFNINALNYIDKKTHSLRYVLKNRNGDIYFVVVFTLVHAEDEEFASAGEGKETEKATDKGSRFDWEQEPSAGDVE